ncbi:helix-turn-helix domain-containing protein [Sphingobacteriaceae bacterium AH-315-L07]|nr:helix-turn-helix domain-containing protein [Sphingobacteriaceae bacterium AH-315-L07]
MEIEIITKQDLKEFKTELITDLHELINGQPKEHYNDWLDTKEAMKLLGIKSKTTLQKLRDNFKIEFSQNKKIIKYKHSSIIKYLEGNVPKQ